MIRTSVPIVLVVALAGCNVPGQGGGPKKAAGGAHAACAGPQVDLAKLSGDWVASAPIKDPQGTYAGDHYRIRFGAPAADGTVKAMMAWRLDVRPFTGKVEKNALGGELALLEDMSDETIANLKKQNNQDPNIPMRAAIRISPSETGCQLDVTDNFQTFLGEKVIEKTSPIGTLKLVPAAAGPTYSFVRCEVPRGITFDGKADEGGQPVALTPEKPAAIRAVAARAALGPVGAPADCQQFDADVFVDGQRVQEKVPAKLGKEDNVDAVIWEAQVAVKRGPLHHVEMHTYAACGERKLVGAVCNYAYAQ